MIGCIVHFPYSPPPPGWVECGGQELNRITYAELDRNFAALGYPFGNGNGTTTFNVPDLRGRVIVGLNTLGGGTQARLTNSRPGGVNASTIGAVGGEETHLLSIDEGPADGQVIPATPTNQALGSGNDYSDSTTCNSAAEPHNNVQPSLVLIPAIWTGVCNP